MFMSFESWLMKYHGKTVAQLSEADLDCAECLYEIERDEYLVVEPVSVSDVDDMPF